MVDRIDYKSRRRFQLWPVALLRIHTGIFFAWHVFGKISGGNFADSMSMFLTFRLESSFPFYRPFIEVFVLPYTAGRVAGLDDGLSDRMSFLR